MSGRDTAGADAGAGGRGRGQPAAAPPPSRPTSGGQFLLQLLQSSSSPSPTPHHHHHHDPAVAVVGPAVPIPSPPPFFSPPLSHSPPAQNLWPQPGRFDPGLPRFPHGQPRPGFLPGHLRPPSPPETKNGVSMEDGLVFGSVKFEAAGVAPTNGLLPGSRAPVRVLDPPPGFGPRRIAQFQRVEGSSPSLHQVKLAGGMQGNGLGQFQRESGRWAEEGGERASNGRDLPQSIRFGSLGPTSGSSLRSGPLVDHGKMINGRSHENVDSEEEEDKDVGRASERLTEILTLGDESAGKNDRQQFGGSRGKVNGVSFLVVQF